MLAVAGWLVMGYVMYKGYIANGSGWLLAGLPIALIGALIVQGIIIRAFPPKLEAHAEGSTWLKLS